MQLCNRGKEIICAKKEKGVSIVNRGEMCKFIEKQLRKEYIRLSKSSQIAPVFFL